ncbi:MAG: TolC family protein [Aquificaceae bacterium]|nr:TolC family protein [Aquificaceae bacterium]MCX8060587.1 TolC family protein [Aquificaceae bacterium]MDW8097046.1 TolC family protein [Aquificaceae bacterium]
MRVAFFLLLSLSLSFSLSLEELLKFAEEKNPALQARRHAVQSARLNLQAEGQLYYPEVFGTYRLSLQAQRQSFNLPAFSIQSSKRSYNQLQLGLRQTLYDGGLRSSLVDISRSSLRIAQEELEEKRLEVRLAVVKAFLAVLSAGELIEVVKKQREAVRADLSQREAFFREGLVAVTDVLQARVRLAEVERDLRRAQGDYLVALADLSRLTGLEEEKLKSLLPPKVEPAVPVLEELLQQALKNRPLLKATEERKKAVTLRRKAELSQFYPKVFLEASYNYSDQNPLISPKGILVLGAGVSLNFQSLAPYYRVLAIEEEKKSLSEELRDLRESVALGVRVAYENLHTAKDNLRVAEESLRFAEEFYRLSLEQYRNQIISGTELLQAEASLTQARKARVLAYYEFLKAYYELLRQVGSL